ncbi:transposable element Tcb2 transposase [Trichonephila clavipes]|nr:transposable element Tcb2 transposase [Trichonephila clavipes]
MMVSLNGLCDASFTIWWYWSRTRGKPATIRYLDHKVTAASGEHRDGSVEDWNRVAWSDESRFRLFNVDGRLRIWCQTHEVMDPACQVGTVQEHGGSIMVWGVFSYHSLGSLACIPTSLNAILYAELLGDHLHLLMMFRYPHDHLWDILEQGGKGHHTAPMNLNELWTVIWKVLPVEWFQKLVESMRHRVAAVINARGSPTRY